MATATDYTIEEATSSNPFDLVILNGDFKKGPSDWQSSTLLLNSTTGSFKFHPFAGMGIKKYKGSSGTEKQMKREIFVQHEADGMKIPFFYVKNFDFKFSIKRPGYDD